MKVLNLDQIESASRKLVLNGVEYAVPPMSVENFITTTRRADEMEKSGATLTDQIEAAIDMIVRSIPSIKRGAVEKLPLEYLEKIVTFIRDDSPEEQVKDEKDNKEENAAKN